MTDSKHHIIGAPPEKRGATHTLKTWPTYFEATKDGTKTFEVRVADRDFRVGDTLDLREYDPDTKRHTGRALARRISYILSPGSRFGFDGFVVLGMLTPADPAVTTCSAVIYHGHHIRRGYCSRDYCQGHRDAQANAPTERAAATGCTGTGEEFGADRDAVIDSLPRQRIPLERCTSLDAVQAEGES